MDDAFCKRQEGGHVVALLVVKHRQSRVARCRMVPQKGALDVAAAGVAGQGIRGFGVTGQVILNTDNEGAGNALRIRVQGLHPGAAFEQTLAAYEHEPNGVIENGNKLGKGYYAW